MHDSWISELRDKARAGLHRFSQILGETDGMAPVSIKDQHRAQKLVEVDLPSFKSVLPYESIDAEDTLSIVQQLVLAFMYCRPLAPMSR